ncbi:helix-turn-helix domain-containing protein [bacterium]|nr:helix-turn-helix domain-containing protein [bacterium]
MNQPETTVASENESHPHQLLDQLRQLDLFRDYARAFAEATGLPLKLAANGHSGAARSCHLEKNPFCELLAHPDQPCEACRRLRQDLTNAGQPQDRTGTCFAGLCESSVPVRASGQVIGYLLTGGIATGKPSQERFMRILRKLGEWGLDYDESLLRQTYFSTPVMSERQYRSILDLLAIFANHLSLIAGQLALRNGNSEAADINRAKEFIREHLTERLDLKQVAERAHLSSCYFCRKFKESTGFTFTEYVSRTRVEAAKTLLANPQARISEVAFEVGFQSLTHFNRVFKVIAGQSPTQYRSELPATPSRPNGHRDLPDD